MKSSKLHWAARLRHSLSSNEVWTAHPLLQRVAGRLSDPQLWRLQHEAVARGVAIGTFWAFIMPVAQIVMAAAHCTWWRANIPVAAAVTMVTNPLTIGFWLWLAYQLGTGVLGEPLLSSPPQAVGVSAWLAEFGWPTVLGMSMFAVGGAALGYLSVKVVWRLRIFLKRLR